MNRSHGCVLGVMLSSVACGSSQPDGLGPIEDFVLQSKQAACENDVACGMTPDLATCLATTFPERTQAAKTLGAAVAAGRVVFDVQAGQACVEALRTLPCTFAARAGGVAACETVFTGTIAIGDACGLDAECLSGDCDFPPDDQSCSTGVCTRVVQDGESCEPDTGTTCRDGSFCLWSPDGADTCRSYALIGTACDLDQPCVPGLVCPFNATTLEFGVCAYAAPAGGACYDADMMFIGCDALDEICDEMTQLCTPRRAVGDACDDDVQCPVYAFCSNGGACALPPTEGSCSTTSGGCLGQIECNRGECVTPGDRNACPLP